MSSTWKVVNLPLIYIRFYFIIRSKIWTCVIITLIFFKAKYINHSQYKIYTMHFFTYIKIIILIYVRLCNVFNNKLVYVLYYFFF